MNKELMEIFFDGKSIVMNDYKELTGNGLTKLFNQKTKYPDKGHQELIFRFFESAKNNSESPISIERILEATKTSLRVNDLVMNPSIHDAKRRTQGDRETYDSTKTV